MSDLLLKQKILDIKQDIEYIVSQYSSEKFWIDWYGAYDINPRFLVFWICIRTDHLKSKLISNGELMSNLRNLLEKHDYPAQARQFVSIGFESQETVDRESKGNWYYHFK